LNLIVYMTMCFSIATLNNESTFLIDCKHLYTVLDILHPVLQ